MKLHVNYIEVNDIEFNVDQNPLVKIWLLSLYWIIPIIFFNLNGFYHSLFSVHYKVIDFFIRYYSDWKFLIAELIDSLRPEW